MAKILISLFIFTATVLGAELRISSEYGFSSFVNNVNSGTSYSGTTVYLDTDLSLSGTTNPIGAHISSTYYRFQGTFDGQGHVISGLTMSSSLHYAGLFGYTTRLTAKNVVMDSSCSFSSSYTHSSHYAYVGGIIGRCDPTDDNCNIENCVNMARVSFSGSSSSNNLYLGGIAGFLYSSSSYNCVVKNCANYGSIVHSGSCGGWSEIGGIAGLSQGYSSSNYNSIQNCINYGSITHSGTSGYSPIGGIVGNSYSYSYFENCVGAGKITYSGSSTSYIGSVVGYIYSNTYINYCYYTSDAELSLYGGGDSPSSTTGSSTSSVSVNTSLISSLNSQATIYGWNKWLLNSDSASVSFKFNDNRGFSVTSQIILLPDLSTTGSNVFKGWFTNTTYSSFFTSQSVSSATTLYGVYGDVVFVTFYGIDGNVFQERKYVAIGYSYGILPTIIGTRTGYTTGWFNASDGGTQVTNETTVSTLSDHNLYARWVPNNYNVYFNANGGGGNVLALKNVVFNSTYGDLPTPSRTGYTFAGWYTETPEGDLVTNSTVVSLPYDHTLYAHWNPIQYTISFVSNGGNKCDNITQDYDTPITLPVLSKTGYTFVCWCNNTDLEFEYKAKRIESRNVTLYARWEANIYTVSFKEECKVLRLPVSVTYNSEYNIQEPSSELGFLWWEIVETGQKVNSESIVEVVHNHTLCAVWKINTVTFNASGGDDNLAPVNVTYGEKYENLTNATRTGYTFVGWFLDESSIEPVTNDTDVTIPYPHTLHARWRINSYTVTFDPDNGENVGVRILEYNSEISYPEDPKKRGYTFSGWDNDVFVFMPAENMTITAQWTPNNYNVTLDVNGGDELDNNKMNVTFDNTYGTLPTPNKTGHTFAGWTDSLFVGNDINNSTIVSIPNNHTLYALWTANQYAMAFVSEGMEPVNFTLNYNDLIIYPNKNPSKSFHRFREWCTRSENGEEECNVTHVPDHNLTFTAYFDVDSSLVTGITAVGAFAVVLFIILIIVIVFLIRVTRTVKHEYEVVGIEMDEDLNERNEDIEERIKQQVEATSISVNIMKKLEKPLKKTDKSKGVEEILMGLEVDCENSGDIDIIDSYRTTNASVAVANAINNEKNLITAAGYLAILYTSVREQEEYEKFNELYFGMKNVDDFMNCMDEKTICFGGIISGFTSKKAAIQFLITKEGEATASMPSGALFRVQNGMGYKIGKVGEGTDEVLFELGGSFKIESMKEINRDKYIVVNLSFISPMTKDEMVNL